jgi:ABC-type transport system substrate-binding protein
MRKVYLFLAILMVASLALSACAPTAPAVTEPPAQEPVVEEPVVEEPVVEEPAEPVALNPYLGSNKLDGNGIPGTFFDDVHIRRGFAYAFDAAIVADEVYNGEAVQSKVLSLPGMPGYDPDAPFYSFDPERAAEEFKLADVDKDGIPAGEDPDDVWEMGFRLQMLYNTGNTTRQIYAEILQANLSAINPKFVVEVLGLPWPAYLTAQRAYKIPIMTGGWLEDIHDAHNWYQPYTTGTYGGRQQLPADLKAQFKELLDKGVALVDPAERHEVYKEFNQLYFDQAVGVPVVLATSHGYEQKWVEGRVLNPIFSGDVFKTMYETEASPDPDTITVASTGDPLVLDPAACYDTASGQVLQNIYETLVFYDDIKTDTFVPMLAESYSVSDDGTVWTFQIREDVKFHEGGDLTASDVAYSFQRGLLQGGYSTPQWLLAEPFFGVGIDDITGIVDDFASADDRESLMANDPATLVAACETVKSKIVADDEAGTVTMTLAQPWGPFLATIANNWGAIMDMEWVIENGGWDGSCDTWQNFYSMADADNPFRAITNGTGAYKLDHWTPDQEVILTAFDGYWGEPAKTERVALLNISEFGTRFAMLQAGDADIIYVPAENRAAVDPMVGEIRIYNPDTNAYDEAVPVCSIDTTKLGLERFELCEEGNGQPLTLYFGRPGLQQDVILFNFNIQ